MGFTIRINYTDVVVKDSLHNFYVKGNKAGYEFKVHLSYYRGHFLSTIKKFDVYVDGEQVDSSLITFTLNGKEWFVNQLPELSSEFWFIKDLAKVKVYKKDGLPLGNHDVKVDLLIRNPYMPAPGNPNERSYATLDSSGENILEIKESGD